MVLFLLVLFWQKLMLLFQASAVNSYFNHRHSNIGANVWMLTFERGAGVAFKYWHVQTLAPMFKCRWLPRKVFLRLPKCWWIGALIHSHYKLSTNVYSYILEFSKYPVDYTYNNSLTCIEHRHQLFEIWKYQYDKPNLNVDIFFF